MSRLTDERIDEILQPKDLIGETELESLAREVRELRAAVSSSDEKYIGLLKVERDSALEALNCSRNKVQQLTRERDQHEAEAKRQHELLHHEHLRANNLECTVRNLELGIEQLTRELAEANRTIDLQSRQIAHQANQCEGIEDERDAAREFNRRFRSFFKPTMNPDVVKYGCHGPCEERDKLIDDYDATQTQHPQPTQTEWVPWTAETRPRGVVMFRYSTDRTREYLCYRWVPDGAYTYGEIREWHELMRDWEWSRDGVNWERCGTEVPK